MREVRHRLAEREDPQDQQHAARAARPRPRPTRPFLCDNPMDMEFGPDGSVLPAHLRRRLLRHQPGRRRWMRWEYVKGLRAPVAVLTADTDRRPGAADGQLLERGLERRRSGRLDPLRVGLRRQRHGRLRRPEPDVHVHDARSVHGASCPSSTRAGRSASANTTITVGNTAPTVTVTDAGRGRDVRLRRRTSRSRSRSPTRRTVRSTAPRSR